MIGIMPGSAAHPKPDRTTTARRIDLQANTLAKEAFGFFMGKPPHAIRTAVLVSIQIVELGQKIMPGMYHVSNKCSVTMMGTRETFPFTFLLTFTKSFAECLAACRGEFDFFPEPTGVGIFYNLFYIPFYDQLIYPCFS